MSVNDTVREKPMASITGIHQTVLKLQLHPESFNRLVNSAGIHSDSIANVDIVSLSLQPQITEGCQFGFFANTKLWLPAESHISHEFNVVGKPAPRLKRELSIQEFVFSKYKHVMCSTYSERQQELDVYQDNIIEICNFYNTKFYDWHKMLSAKAATILREKHIKVDWSNTTGTF